MGEMFRPLAGQRLATTVLSMKQPQGSRASVQVENGLDSTPQGKRMLLHKEEAQRDNTRKNRLSCRRGWQFLP